MVSNIGASEAKSKASVAKTSKQSQKRKEVDDMNKSIDSTEELQHRLIDSGEETGKIPILASVKYIKG